MPEVVRNTLPPAQLAGCDRVIRPIIQNPRRDACPLRHFHLQPPFFLNDASNFRPFAVRRYFWRRLVFFATSFTINLSSSKITSARLMLPLARTMPHACAISEVESDESASNKDNTRLGHDWATRPDPDTAPRLGPLTSPFATPLPVRQMIVLKKPDVGSNSGRARPCSVHLSMITPVPLPDFST